MSDNLEALAGLTVESVGDTFLARVPGASATGPTKTEAVAKLRRRLARGLALIDNAVKANGDKEYA